MLQSHTNRKLSVIVSADVAGYAKLTELNETGIHNLLQKRLGALRQFVTQYNGQILRIHGDGCLCSFDSIISAFRACLEIQYDCRLFNSEQPEINQIWFRIGVHVSEVIIDGSEQYGNGVNIAVRLQQNANSGEVLVSNKTIDLLGDANQFTFSKVSNYLLKNISSKIPASKLLGLSTLNNVAPAYHCRSPIEFRRSIVMMMVLVLVLNAVFLFKSYMPLYKDLDASSPVSSGHLSEQNYNYVSSRNVTSQIEDDALKVVGHLDESKRNEASLKVEEENALRFEKIEKTLQSLKNELSLNEQSVNAQLLTVSGALSTMQNNQFYRKDDVRVNGDFRRVNIDETYESSQFGGSANYDESLYSLDYVADSINMLDANVQTGKVTSGVAKNEYFGCLSCMQSNSHLNTNVMQNIKEEKNNHAILIGRISGDGAQYLNHKINMLENYLYKHLQDSIRQSNIGAQVERFTQIANHEGKQLNDAYFEELCVSDNAMLIASYELVTNRWSSEGTYMRFYHCNTKKSVVHMEKNLAPTIMNVPKPYLTEDAWKSVDKSVDYLMGKLVANQVEYL